MSDKRDHYTQHGLHMNKIGKEWITRKMAMQYLISLCEYKINVNTMYTT
jgi:protein associated with RNAse G/E